MEWLSIVAPITGALLLIGALFNFSVIRPLNTAIENLNQAINMMKEQLHEVEAKRQSMAERLAKVEASTASAHHRIDALRK